MIMNTSHKILISVTAFMLTACTLGYQASDDPDPSDDLAYQQTGIVSLQVFYDQLSPYGTWVSYRDYGYVWIPNAGPNFQPYGTSGYWVFTNAGWTWYSTYSWGWAPFHYGRWFFDNYYGWMWLPDTQWGPAWVVWRSGGDYYGWAPLEPGITVTIALGGAYQVPTNRWIFVRSRDIDRRNVYSYSVNRTNNTTIINNTTVIRNTRQDQHRQVTYTIGPDREEVQRVKGKPVKEVVVQDHSRLGQNRPNKEMRQYKPKVEQDRDQRKPAPTRVEKLENVRPNTERYQNRPQRQSTPLPPRKQNQGNSKSKNAPRKKGN
jgi:hypothetical protein